MKPSKSRKSQPKLRPHKATGRRRVILSGQHFYTKADFDTPEAHAEYLELLRKWCENSCQPLRPVATPTELDSARTVAELADAYLRELELSGCYRKNGKPTSQMGLVSVALEELKATSGRITLSRFRKANLIRHRDSLRQRDPLRPARSSSSDR